MKFHSAVLNHFRCFTIWNMVSLQLSCKNLTHTFTVAFGTCRGRNYTFPGKYQEQSKGRHGMFALGKGNHPWNNPFQSVAKYWQLVVHSVLISAIKVWPHKSRLIHDDLMNHCLSMICHHAFYINRLLGETKTRLHSNPTSVKLFSINTLVSLIKN